MIFNLIFKYYVIPACKVLNKVSYMFKNVFLSFNVFTDHTF